MSATNPHLRLTLAAAVCLLWIASTAQTSKELPNSGDIISQGEKLYDNGHFKEALALYRKVSPSDTDYSTILHELSMTAYQDSDFVGAKRYAEQGLKRFPENALDWYVLRAQAEDDMGDKDSAVADYDRVITQNPYNYSGWFNKGVCLFREERIPEAKACFERCLLIYPYQTSAHYFIGLIAVKNGSLAPAMLSFMTALVMNPEGRYTKKIIGFMTAIATVNDEVARLSSARASDGTFDTEQEILLSKAALDKQYPLHSEVEDPITRQMQVLLEKMAFQPDDTGFWMQYYVPFYKDVFAIGDFDIMVHQMFGGLGIKTVDEWNKKHKSDHEAFIHHAYLYFKTINETERLQASTRDTATAKYLFEDDALEGIGFWKDGPKAEKLLSGPWTFYFKNGRVKSRGLLDDQVQKQGDWVFYHSNGTLEEKSTFKDNKRVGPSTSWYDNGVRSETDQYVDGEMDGEINTWFYNGERHFVLVFSKGKRNGLCKEYSSDGWLQEVTNYVDDHAEGVNTQYFADGKTSGVFHYSKGDLDGPVQKFNENGVLTTEGSYTGGKKSGSWKTYFPSTHVHETYAFVDGVMEGEYTEYYDNGQVSQRLTYVKGRPEGKTSSYTEGGRLSGESVYERGKVREVQFFGQDGKPFPPSSIRGGAGNLVFYDSLGNKESEGVFTKFGDKEGKMSYYYSSGALSGYSIYKDDEHEGPRVNYYHNGGVMDSTNYTGDSEEGYYAFYYPNGTLKQDGWYNAGQRTGPLTEYDPMGKVMSSCYYNAGDRNGFLTAYAPNGRRIYEYTYQSGWPSHFTQWDTAERVTGDRDLRPGDTVFIMKHMNGKEDARGGYTHLHNNGEFDYFFFDGSLNTRKFYRYGLEDSVFKQYFYGGKIKQEGRFHLGDKEGTWTEYHENGQPRYIEHYKGDKLEGVSVFYNPDGTKTKEVSYRNDQQEGPETHYGLKNELSYVLYFHEGDAIGYSYNGKDGHLVPMIPLKARSGKVTAWYPNGQKSAEFELVDNVLEGQRTLYFSNGQVDFSVKAENGEYVGPVMSYYPNGKVLSEENEYYDNYQGVCKYYYASGVLRLEAYYYNGDPEGAWKYYDENGHLQQTRIYYYGDLQAVY